MQNPPSPSVHWSDVTSLMIVLQNGPLRAKRMNHFQTWVAETDCEPSNGKSYTPHGVCMILLRTSLTFWSWIITGLLLWETRGALQLADFSLRNLCSRTEMCEVYRQHHHTSFPGTENSCVFLNKKNVGTSAHQHCTITVSHLQGTKVFNVYRWHHRTSLPRSEKS